MLSNLKIGCVKSKPTATCFCSQQYHKLPLGEIWRYVSCKSLKNLENYKLS